MKPSLALNFLMSQPWALDKQLLSDMGDIANRDANNITLPDLLPKSLEGKTGVKVGRKMEIREGGVALIHVNGVISRYAGMFDDICGGTSTQALAKDLTAAREDPAVSAIILYVDSPGGHADGIHELAEMIHAIRDEKSIVAYVGGQACSAGYWLASAAQEVVLDATARVGSIGTVINIRRRKVRENDDYETLEIVSNQSPNKRLDPGSEAGRKAYQQQLDELADVFIDRVARNMSVTTDQVLSDFGGGGVSIGQSAVDKGMAHRLGSLEGVIAEFQKGKTTTMSDKNKPTGAKAVASLALPNVEALDTEAFVAAIAQERPDVQEAMQGKPPEMALENAASIAERCATAGIPALSASLLKDGVSLAQANETIAAATQLKDTLTASGLSGSFEALIGAINNPVELVGKAIHEVKAAADENGDQSRHIVDNVEGQTNDSGLSASSVYQKRK